MPMKKPPRRKVQPSRPTTPKKPRGSQQKKGGSQNRQSGGRRGGGKPSQSSRRASHSRGRRPAKKAQKVRLGKDTVRIIPLGGLEEVGRNMMVIEYGNDQIVIDAGLSFSTEETPGIDFVIPNVEYLKNSKKKLHGILLTHGHYDHMGALPFILRDIGNPDVWATPLTRDMIRRRHSEFRHAPKLNVHTIEKDNVKAFQLGPFIIEWFHVNHNIPDSVGYVIKTPVGRIVNTGDFKFDYRPIGDIPADLQRIGEIGSRGVLALLSDSTGAERPGHSLSESVINENLDSIIRDAPGRVIIATFASLIGRHQQIYQIAEKYGRRVSPSGFSMKTNFEIARQLKLIDVPKNILLPAGQIDRNDPKKTIVLCTGAQGEPNAALFRIANKEHRHVTLQPDDTVIFSSSVIPGNERSVQNVKDQLLKQGAKVFHYRMVDVHTGGHAQAEDLKLMISLIKPKFLIPIHGQHSMLREHANIGQLMEMPEENTAVGYNGAVIEFDENNIVVRDEDIPSNPVFVDGLGVGDVREVVMRDRLHLAEDGMFVIVAKVDRKSGKVVGDPDIISRGFIYLRENGHLVAQARKKVVEVVERSTKAKPIDDKNIRKNIQEELGNFFNEKTQRRPMILPMIIEV